MEPDPRDAKGHQRDVALMLLGAALVKDERKRVLDSIPSGVLCQEVDKLFDAMREGKYMVLKEWLDTRGCVIEEGKDGVQALVDSAIDTAKRAEVKQIVKRLGFAVKIETVDQLKDHLRDCLDRLEAIA